MSVIFDIVLWFVLLIVLPVLVYLLYDQKKNVWEKQNIPFLKKDFFFGNAKDAFFIRESLSQMFDKLYKKAGDVPYVGFYVFNKPSILIKDPELIKNVLVKDFNNFANRNFHIDKKVDPEGYDMMFTNTTDRWRTVRNKSSPIFTTGKIKHMFSLMTEIAEDMTKKLATEMESADGIDASDLNAQYTTDIVCSVVLGFKSDCLINPDSKLRTLGKMAFEISYRRAFEFMTFFFLPTLATVLRLQLFPTSMKSHLMGTFWEIFKHREEKQFKRNDLVDMFIQLKNKANLDSDRTLQENCMTDKEIEGTIITFFAAGFETTASTMTYTMYELAMNQSIQDKLRQEIQQALTENDGKISYEVLQSLKYLDCCVNEALRKHPLLAFLDRRCVNDYKIPCGDLVIPAGAMVYVSLDGLHLDEKHFPEPEKYDPERFSDERKKEIVPYTFMPFGEGPRNCIGMRFGVINAKNGLLHVINRFRIEPCSDTPRKIEYSEKSLLNAPKKVIKLKFIPLS